MPLCGLFRSSQKEGLPATNTFHKVQMTCGFLIGKQKFGQADYPLLTGYQLTWIFRKGASVTANENHKKCETRANNNKGTGTQKKTYLLDGNGNKSKAAPGREKRAHNAGPSERCQNQQFSSCKQFHRKQGAQHDAILPLSHLAPCFVLWVWLSSGSNNISAEMMKAKKKKRSKIK